MTTYNYLMKFILIGNSGVGKSSMLFQFIEDKFRDGLEPTIGIEFGTKLIKIDNMSIRLQIWDSAGQENYRSITRSYYRNTICAFLMYDITNRKSFDDVKSWLEEAKTYGNSTTHFVLLANKCDIQQERVVSIEEGTKFAQDNGMAFFEISAKVNINVNKAFEYTVERILYDIKQGVIDPYHDNIGIKIGVTGNRPDLFVEKIMAKRKKRKCC